MIKSVNYHMTSILEKQRKRKRDRRRKRKSREEKAGERLRQKREREARETAGNVGGSTPAAGGRHVHARAALSRGQQASERGRGKRPGLGQRELALPSGRLGQTAIFLESKL